jgi:hypothetical protein
VQIFKLKIRSGFRIFVPAFQLPSTSTLFQLVMWTLHQYLLGRMGFYASTFTHYIYWMYVTYSTWQFCGLKVLSYEILTFFLIFLITKSVLFVEVLKVFKSFWC